MKNRFAAVTVTFVASLVFCGLMVGNPKSDKTQAVASIYADTTIVSAPRECADCENRCETWINRCKEGGQYACYKAAACLCKCNLDEGGCGSSKDALRECYEQNEKLARELGPPEER